MEEKKNEEAVKRFEGRKLYEVSLGLEAKTRKEVGLRFSVKAYTQDPLVAQKREKGRVFGIEDIEVDWDPSIMDGPTSARVAVVDYNADTGILAKPVAWDGEKRVFVDADNPESFAFHQVNVWAIVQSTLAFFEDPTVMGRPIPWGFNGNRLIVVPHAGMTENAFYNREGKCLQFYYFMSADNRPIYTCLCRDIVSHETGHAVLDGIRPFYYEVSSVQTSAFHEYVADLTAILSALRINVIRQAVADISEGNLWKAKVITDLGEQFAAKETKETYGAAQRYYLRTARNKKTMKDIENCIESHTCSEVLTGAIFRILARITKIQMDQNNSPREALWKATQHVNRLAFRALDYGPPVDIQFEDYAQALLRANELAYPIDTLGYTKVIKDVFTKRGIGELTPMKPPNSADLIWKYTIANVASSRTTAYHFLNDNRSRLEIPVNQDFEVADLYYTDKVVTNTAGGGIQRLPREIILEYVWREDAPLEGERFGRFRDKTFSLLCGGTLVFDERRNLLYWSKKVGTQEGEKVEDGERRKQQLLDYVERLIRAGMISETNTEAFRNVSSYQPPLISALDGNALHLEMTPQFLHANKEDED